MEFIHGHECVATKITYSVGCSNNTNANSGMNFLFFYLRFFFFLFRFHFGLFLSEGIKGAFVFTLRSLQDAVQFNSLSGDGFVVWVLFSIEAYTRTS